MENSTNILDTPLGQSNLGEMLPYFIVLAILILFIAFCIKAAISSSKAQSKIKQDLKKLKENGMIHQATFTHLYGLPISENSICNIRLYNDRLEFISNSTTVSLEKERLTDVTITTDVEIQKHYVSSAGGAVAGAVMFGPIGALIGGRAKEKKTRTVTPYLIFSYEKNGEIKFIGFNISGTISKAQKFIDDFKQMQKNTTVIL